MYDLDPYLGYIHPSTCFLPFLLTSVVPWELTDYPLDCFYSSV